MLKKHHLEFNKYFIAAILGSFFFGVELVISRLILDFYSPMTFYFLRSLGVLLLSFIIFKPKINKFKTTTRFQILGLGLIWVIFRVIVYYGYLNLGVIYTTLVMMLGPIFIYALAWKFLKDKISWKNIAASIVIVGCVVYVVLS